MGRRKTFAIVLAVGGAVATTAWLAAGKAAAPTPVPAAATYARLAAAPPAPAELVASAPLRAMAHRSSIDPAGLLATPMNQRNGDGAIDFLAGSPKGIIDPDSRDWYRRKHGLTNNRNRRKAQIERHAGLGLFRAESPAL